MTTLGIHHLCALDLQAEQFIHAAASAGFQQVSLFTQAFSATPFPLVDENNIQQVKEALSKTGITVNNAECFMLIPGVDVSSFDPALERGKALGARGATALIYDNDLASVKQNLIALCELAGKRQLRVNIEFMPLAALCKNLQQALDLINELSLPNLGLGVDLLHFIRSGGKLDELVAAANAIHYVQICDGKHLDVTEDYAEEAGGNRLPPGEGVFPVVEFLRALPSNTPIEVEAPQQTDLSAKERLENIFDSTQQQLRQAGLL